MGGRYTRACLNAEWAIRNLIFVTTTSQRPGRLDYFRRHIRTLISKIDDYLWVVVEDGELRDPELTILLAGWNSHYLHSGDAGGGPLNLAFEYIRDRRWEGVVYCLEEDDLVLPELAAELRKIAKLGIVPVGNLGPNGVERPILSGGKLLRWDCGWAERKFPVAKGGFGFESRLIFDAPSPIWAGRGLGGETEFIEKFIRSADELDLSPCHGNQVCLVFHKEPLASLDLHEEAPTRIPAVSMPWEDQPPASQYAPSGPPPRMALVGCGWFACEAHLPALLRLENEGRIKIVALCSRSTESLARASARLGGRPLKLFTDFGRLLEDSAIDLLDLVLPTPLMPAAIRAAWRAGKSVISEKPCAPSLAASLELFEAYRRLETPHFWAVAENWRFKATTKLIEQIVKSGQLGPIYLADLQCLTGSSPSFSGGWRGAKDYPGGHLIDIGVHFIALLRQAVGEVVRVSANVSQRRPQLAPADSVTSVLNFANGAEGAFQLSLAARPQDARPSTLTLIGEKGSLHVDLSSGLLRLRVGEQEQALRAPDDPWVQGGVYATLAHCIDAFRHDAPLFSSASEALRDLAVMEAMLQSGRAGAPVQVATLYPALHGTPRKVAAYSGAWTFQPARTIECGSIAEVSRAVAEAAAAGLRIRPMGTASSWGPEIVTNEVCLRLGRLNRIHGLDSARGTVSVEAGVRLGDLTRMLAAHGRSLPSLPFNPNVTIGGAVATATHGSSAKMGTLSDGVAAMKLVVASGEILELDPRSSPDELRAARVAVGMLGAVVELELETIAMTWVRPTRFIVELSAFLEHRNAILNRFDHVWGHWTLGADTILLECLESRPQPEPEFHPYVVGDNGSWLALRGPAPPASAITVTRGGERLIWMSMQYGVALDEIEPAIEAIRASPFAKAHAERIVEIKFLKHSDRSWLGPNAQRDSIMFNIWWSVDESLKFEVFAPFEAVLRGMRARPHWGKLHRLPDPTYMQAAYPGWEAFEAIRARLDPRGMFSIFKAE